jgi:hypothetical protein
MEQDIALVKYFYLLVSVRFVGACIDPFEPVLVTEYCPRGSLQVPTTPLYVCVKVYILPEAMSPFTPPPPFFIHLPRYVDISYPFLHSFYLHCSLGKLNLSTFTFSFNLFFSSPFPNLLQFTAFYTRSPYRTIARG